MINGCLRDEIICRVCGEAGHKIFEVNFVFVSLGEEKKIRLNIGGLFLLQSVQIELEPRGSLPMWSVPFAAPRAIRLKIVR